MQLSDDISFVKGVGDTVVKKLHRLGIHTVADLINHFPRRYDDFSTITPLNKLKAGMITVEGQILRVATRRTQRGRSITEAIIDDDTGAVKAVWFNQPYLSRTLPKNQPVFASGNLEFKYSSFALQSPVIEKVNDFPKDTARIVPVYPETEGLSSKQLRSLLRQVKPVISELPDYLPRWLLKKAQLITKAQAVESLHFPESMGQLQKARRRMAFEEVFILVLTGLVLRQEIKTESAPQIAFNAATAQQFTAALPFEFTNAQRKAAWQILKDIDTSRPMNRLLQGDVGSGKTVVAALAILMTVRAGYQAALMAPTEVLARQHAQTLESILAKFKVKVGLLVGGMKPAPKKASLAAITEGEAQCIVGTQALLQADVVYRHLGLVIIDEQHRFGVGQRQALKQKGQVLPHLLSMTATPIPRSLALTVYGDLDVSVIDELPKDRQPIITQVVAEAARHQVYRHIDNHISQGRQVYVICPLVAESDVLGVKSVEAEAKRLKHEVFKSRKIGLLHGRLKPVEKTTIMEQFKNGALDILVSTTVVEVGVDVPNATIMLVEGAERFGLAALHQLRGRVGRSKHQSYCYVVTSNPSQSLARLSLLERYQSGFILAEKDLELRGAGEIYGLRQHGELDLRFAQITDTSLINEAQQYAKTLTAEPTNLLQYPELVKNINRHKAITNLD